MESKFKYITFLGTFGQPVSIIAEITGNKTHGFFKSNEPFSSWFLNKGKMDNCVPAEFTIIREKGKRKKSVIADNRIIKIEDLNKDGK
jgi:hypothetical protein